jgi:small acid-soluble spore protein (thioredoxin-like protein)
MDYQNKPKSDDRSDNVEKLQEMIHNTIENIETSKGALKGSLEVTDSSEQ